MLFVSAPSSYMGMSMNKIAIEIAYATPTKQIILALEVPSSCTIEEAIRLSRITESFPEIDLQKQKVGVFSKIKKLSDTLKAGDRIEIYRPLIIDPKEARRAKAKKTHTRSS
jgi:putative ubiquitin-RnfH superfamily antitoxin RatB of RatAB toxin-antitoxin module